MRATGGCIVPLRQGSRGESADGAGRRVTSTCAESPGHGVQGLSVYFSAASRPIELSLQSSFQLSLMVLVIYRSRA